MWQSDAIFELHLVSAALRYWLELPSSMTEQMHQICSNVVVEVVHNEFCTPHPDESAKLKLAPNTRVWCREVVMKCDQEAWLYARTMIPEYNLKGKVLGLTKIGGTPIGNVLFSDPATRRSSFEFTLVSPKSFYATQASHQVGPIQEPLWARRSIFTYDHQDILLTEVFLPLMIKKIYASHSSPHPI